MDRSPTLRTSAAARIAGRHLRRLRPRVFPWAPEQPTRKELERATSKLSRQFTRIFEAAGCADLNFHDLRHEATSRLFERTKLSDLEIAKITGHKDARMLARYANLRASNLAKHLW